MLCNPINEIAAVYPPEYKRYFKLLLVVAFYAIKAAKASKTVNLML